MFLAPSVADCALASVVATCGGLSNPWPPRCHDDHVWRCMNRSTDMWSAMTPGTLFHIPQRMTPLCSPCAPERGRGLDRWICAMERFCLYQLREEVMWQNRILLAADTCCALYAEIDRILPSLQYCRVGDTARMPGDSSPVVSGKTRADLDRHAALLYEWLDGPSQWQIGNWDPAAQGRQMSTVRAVAEWQCAGGVSFDAVMNHRAARCFKYHGNSGEFQVAVRSGHVYSIVDGGEGGGASPVSGDVSGVVEVATSDGSDGPVVGSVSCDVAGAVEVAASGGQRNVRPRV